MKITKEDVYNLACAAVSEMGDVFYAPEEFGEQKKNLCSHCSLEQFTALPVIEGGQVVAYTCAACQGRYDENEIGVIRQVSDSDEVIVRQLTKGEQQDDHVIACIESAILKALAQAGIKVD